MQEADGLHEAVEREEGLEAQGLRILASRRSRSEGDRRQMTSDRHPNGVEKAGKITYILGAVPVWRNWQTRWTQNPVRSNLGVGSIPSTGISYLSRISATYGEP